MKKADFYTPPFERTAKAINLISEISEKVGMLTALSDNPIHVELRKRNRIKTIHSSLSIENNSLNLEQITAIVEGKRVLGSPNEIQEVKNAIQAYELLLELNPHKEKDLLRAHRLMMMDLVDGNGKYRTDGVGIFNGDKLVHVAPPADRVPYLMADLFKWLKTSKEHPLIKSCVFHYEFEFIHPFQDGNGRMGRFWQTVILKEWKPIFAWIPIETIIKERQGKYYAALNASDNHADSTEFIEFMLEVILDEMTHHATQNRVTKKVTVKVTANQKNILQAIAANPFVTQEELAKIIGISRKNIATNMKKLQECGMLKRIGANKNGCWQIE